MYGINGNINTRFLGDILGTVGIRLLGIIIDDPAPVFLGLLPGKNTFNLELLCRAQPETPGSLLYKGKITYSKKVLWLINVNTTITDRSYNAPNILPIDQTPGGWFKTGLSASDEEKRNWLIRYNIAEQGQPHFNFIPVPSALDIGRGGQTLTLTDYRLSYAGANPPPPPKDTPFANFVTAYNLVEVVPGVYNENEGHVDIYWRNGDWLAAELNNFPIVVCDCPGLVDPTISGPSSATCPAEITYSISTVPPGVTINWTTSNHVIEVSGQGTSTYKVRPVMTGNAWVRVELTNPCGSVSSNPKYTQIYNGMFYDYIVISGDELCYPNRYYTFQAVNNSSIPATGWVWHIDDYNWEIIYQQNSSWDSYIDVELPYYYYGYETDIWVEVLSECGTTLSEFYHTQTCYEPYTIYPNPADQYIEVSLKNDGESDLTALPEDQTYIYIKELKLYNDNSSLVKHLEFKAPMTRIETADLPRGLYILHIIRIDGIDRKQVMIGR